jgi:DNA gyrase subunit A
MGFFFRPDMSETTKNGRRFARVKDDDEIVTVSAAGGDTVTAATSGGKVLVFDAAELSELSGPGRGVILMRVDKKDRLIGALCHAAGETPVAVGEDGSERRFHAPSPGKRAQTGRKALKRFHAVELAPRGKDE